ncbi:MAG: 5'/3'-nucleotidase SurE [Candidatus Tritonobacter lacicola]|nr:5'/3'-nucleotidase SurE [Candidatus Tritonobacter lacicola]
MRVLLTNDDGINSPGLHALWERVREVADVVVVAPATEQSAVGHAITLSSPLRIEEVRRDGSVYGYAVNGTPADCVKIAISTFLKETPDIVVSGINLGPNTGTNVIYSGTVSAATEGTILGIPSMAVSLTTFTDPHYDYAAKLAGRLVTAIHEHGLPDSTLLNVNVPNVTEDKIAGIRITRQGKSKFKEFFDKRIDPKGGTYYWLAGDMVDADKSDDCDHAAIRSNFVSITPLHYDMTNAGAIEEIQSWNL